MSSHRTLVEPMPTPDFSLEFLRQRLGTAAAGLCLLVAEHAHQQAIKLYLVGGVNRDVLLKRHTDDLDFAVEGDQLFAAVDFARTLQSVYGGKLTPHSSFGTVKWQLDGDSGVIVERLGVGADELPDHLDFAITRAEIYAYPTALPTVSPATIEHDLKRRDFTINTLALQLSPSGHQWRLLDLFNGIDDIRTGTIRVLHDASFVDDPTRILRGVRFAERFKFTIEPHTATLITRAHQVLGRITGERIRHELMLILAEAEPERALLDLQERGVLAAIHPALRFDKGWINHFETARRATIRRWDDLTLKREFAAVDLDHLLWHCWFSQLDDISAICERLLCSGTDKTSLIAAANLTRLDTLTNPNVKHSEIAFQLDKLPEIALLAAWIVCDSALVRERLERYLQIWRHTRPMTTGNTLKDLGLPPGPRYKQLLERLRAARIDGEIMTDADEQHLLTILLATPPEGT